MYHFYCKIKVNSMKKNSLFFTLLLTVSYTQAMKLIEKHKNLIAEPEINNPWLELLPREVRSLTIEHLFPEIEQTDLDILSDLHMGQVHIAYKKSSEYAQLYPMIDLDRANANDLQTFINNPYSKNEKIVPISEYMRLTKDQCKTLSHATTQQINNFFSEPVAFIFEKQVSITLNKT